MCRSLPSISKYKSQLLGNGIQNVCCTTGCKCENISNSHKKLKQINCYHRRNISHR